MFTGDALEILILIAVIGLSFGALTAQVAHLRGRNDFLWLLLSLFLGPFALLIVALIRKGQGPRRRVSTAALVAAALAFLLLLLLF